MKLVSTRDFSQKADLSYALLNPSGSGGGLFSPERLPLLSEDFFKQCEDLSYKQIALKIIESFDFDVSSEVFEDALKRYDKFENPACPVGRNIHNILDGHLASIQQAMERTMESTTLADVIAEAREQMGEED